MKGRSQEQKDRDHTFLTAGALIVASAIVIGIPPVESFRGLSRFLRKLRRGLIGP